MKEEEIRILANDVLRPILGPVGFTSSDVEAGPDHEGDDSIFVTAHFAPGSKVASGKTYNAASVALWDALTERGDRRFPYFRYDYPDDPPPFDEEEVYGPA